MAASGAVGHAAPHQTRRQRYRQHRRRRCFIRRAQSGDKHCAAAAVQRKPIPTSCDADAATPGLRPNRGAPRRVASRSTGGSGACEPHHATQVSGRAALLGLGRPGGKQVTKGLSEDRQCCNPSGPFIHPRCLRGPLFHWGSGSVSLICEGSNFLEFRRWYGG